jgi:cysteine desulfurase
VEGFADAARGGGRGAFVPAQDRIKSLASAWKQVLNDAVSRHWLLPSQVSELVETFSSFESLYNTAVVALCKSALAIDEVSQLATTVKERDPSILFHSDATQAVGKLTVDLATDLGDIDLLSFSAHKFHGPKGVGALFVRDRIAISPILHGGGQQNGIRSGTENPAGIVGMVTALAIIMRDMGWTNKIRELRDHLESRIHAIHPSAFILGAAAERVPTTTYVCLPGIDGDDLVDRLAARNIAISTGSACSFGSIRPSHVALAHGLSYEHAKSCIRLSLSMETTEEEVELFLRDFEELVVQSNHRMEIGT